MSTFSFQFTMPVMNADTIRNRVPGVNEKFTSSSQSSHSFVNIVNGKKTEGGGASELTNNNGDVAEKAMEYTKKDPD